MAGMEDALLLIESIRSALAEGTKYYNMDGKELKTVQQIARTLVAEGEVRVQERGHVGKMLKNKNWKA